MTEQWNHCLSLAKARLTPELFNTWIPPIKAESFDGQKLVIVVPNKEFINIFVEQVGSTFGTILREVFGAQMRVDWQLPKDEDPNADAGRAFTTKQPPSAVASTAQATQPTAPTVSARSIKSNLVPDYNFENFCSGTANQVALSVAQAIVNDPTKQTFNPFFLYGPPGVGKTHLVNAVGLAVQQKRPDWRILMLSAQTFQTQYTHATTGKNNELNNFVHFYQSIDLLIIDDFQFMTGQKTLTSFFHIFNHLHQNKRKILITCDRAPSEFEGLEERMLTRLKWGVVADIQRPDAGLRQAILAAKLRQYNISFPPEVVDYIADHVCDSVRELQGTINSMLAFHMADNCPLDLDLAQRIVPRLVNQSKRELTFATLSQEVCRHFNLRPTDLTGKSRQANIAAARQLLMFLTQKYTKLSLTQIGRELGGRDHSTVRHACSAIERRLSTDKEYRLEIELFEATLI